MLVKHVGGMTTSSVLDPLEIPTAARGARNFAALPAGKRQRMCGRGEGVTILPQHRALEMGRRCPTDMRCVLFTYGGHEATHQCRFVDKHAPVPCYNTDELQSRYRTKLTSPITNKLSLSFPSAYEVARCSYSGGADGVCSLCEVCGDVRLSQENSVVWSRAAVKCVCFVSAVLTLACGVVPRICAAERALGAAMSMSHVKSRGLARGVPSRGTLRLHVFSGSSVESGQVTVHVVGRVLGLEGMVALSDVIDSVEVSFGDERLAAAKWQAGQGTKSKKIDRLSVTRLAPPSTSCHVVLALHLRAHGEKWLSLDATLSALLGVQVETKRGAALALWAYCRSRRLVLGMGVGNDKNSDEAHEAGLVALDEQLRVTLRAAGCPPAHPELAKGKMAFSTLCAYVLRHMGAAAHPVLVQHEVGSGCKECYDVGVDLPLVCKGEHPPAASKEAAGEAEVALRVLCGRLVASGDRAALLRAFSCSPGDASNTLVLSQARDLAAVAQANARRT